MVVPSFPICFPPLPFFFFVSLPEVSRFRVFLSFCLIEYQDNTAFDIRSFSPPFDNWFYFLPPVRRAGILIKFRLFFFSHRPNKRPFALLVAPPCKEVAPVVRFLRIDLDSRSMLPFRPHPERLLPFGLMFKFSSAFRLKGFQEATRFFTRPRSLLSPVPLLPPAFKFLREEDSCSYFSSLDGLIFFPPDGTKESRTSFFFRCPFPRSPSPRAFFAFVRLEIKDDSVRYPCHPFPPISFLLTHFRNPFMTFPISDGYCGFHPNQAVSLFPSVTSVIC